MDDKNSLYLSLMQFCLKDFQADQDALKEQEKVKELYILIVLFLVSYS